MTILIWILFAVSAVLIVVSFIMAPSSNAFSGALVGSSDLDLFKVSKERGSKKILKWIMFSGGIVLMITALIIRSFI
ncbi:preprotein translocase subunit SecG [Candidatus Mycoplasma mahonii]|uniref:preprotein translocase subunit SecG n=1 Tax=Candidatus Mycoplasma mahonii TaxID=3004105 RepID=UPI0026EE20AA|nr:preprotein translocase subunit SecG [Candidatus Mycoplasma mahonii]WKX02508.1 preprotein translocase subunit SecG [Candidatus Mycoplasma mahonii]